MIALMVAPKAIVITPRCRWRAEPSVAHTTTQLLNNPPDR